MESLELTEPTLPPLEIITGEAALLAVKIC
jgi:hypothetical protein